MENPQIGDLVTTTCDLDGADDTTLDWGQFDQLEQGALGEVKSFDKEWCLIDFYGVLAWVRPSVLALDESKWAR